MKDGYRKFLSFLDESPRVEACLEIFFTVVISFAPFLLASLFAQASETTFSQTKYTDVFYSYFSGGELSLLILAACSSIVWISFIRPRGSSLVGRIVAALVVVTAILFVGGVIGTNPGFSDDVPRWLLSVVTIIYLVALFMWFFVSAQKSGAIPRSRSEERAKAIRREAHPERNR